MRILINGFLIFLLWAIFCRYWYVCKIKHHCDEAPADIEMVATSVRAMDLGLYQGDSLILGGYEQLAFIGPGVQPELTASNELFLDSVAAWMNRHPESALTLTGSYRLSEEGNTSGFFENLGLARAAGLRQLLVDRGVKSLTITGHTDALSGDAYNMELGRRRAQAVRRYLEQRGIKTNFKIASAGEREPVASNDTEEGRAKNRRVNLSIN
ncbi:MAG: OmpA family protein [Saprospiraceae bacterium]|nr:OmpA family protein [Saprospiraceae bacterium]